MSPAMFLLWVMANFTFLLSLFNFLITILLSYSGSRICLFDIGGLWKIWTIYFGNETLYLVIGILYGDFYFFKFICMIAFRFISFSFLFSVVISSRKFWRFWRVFCKKIYAFCCSVVVLCALISLCCNKYWMLLPVNLIEHTITIPP